MISLSKIDKLLKTFRQWELDKVKHTEVSDYFAKVIFVENSKNSLVDFFNVEDNLSLVLNQIKAFNFFIEKNFRRHIFIFIKFCNK